jgi:putative hydroxymethylpyrimidine transport system substrate-binding protein
VRAAPTKNLAIPARRVMWAVLALTAALALSACGEKKEPLTGGGPGQKVDLDLDFYVNADHAGIYTAIDRGFFKAAGLNVDPHVPTDPAGPIKQVAAGRADFAISYEPEVLLARAQGLPVTAVAAVVNQPLTSLISLPTAGINTPADLAGKKVATAGIPYQEDYLDSILNAANVDPDKVGVTNVGLNLLPALLGGQADAILGGFSNIEGVDLQMRGASPHIQPVSQLGVPTYDELVLVANSDDVKKDSDEIRLFINALALGTKYAAANPKVATASVLKAGSGLDPTVTAKEVATTLPLLYPPPAAKKPEPYGYMDPTEWETFAGFMVGAGAMDQVPSIGDALTDDLLPPTG